VPSPRDEETRAAGLEQLKQLDASRLVVIDECGSNIGLTPLYARAPKGSRAHGSIPRHRGKIPRLYASLNWSGIGACMIIEGSTTAAAFELYVEKILAPSLTQVVIWVYG
jgi:hypothetical protein